MECKNCELPLRTDYSYCSNCGAKVIRNRLTIKNLWYDVTERYFNVDNTFLKTFLHLSIKPETVIGSYIDGIRKKYLNPISYYAIALTLSGVLLFLLGEFFSNQMNMDWMFQEGADNPGADTMDKTAKYQSVISVISIPFYALISKLIFLNEKSMNYTEHIILNLYIFAQFTIVTFTIYLIFLMLGFNFLKITYTGLLFYVIYMAFAMKRIFKLSLGRIIWKTVLFLLLLFAAFIMTSIVTAIIMIVTNGLPQPPA